MNIKKVMFIGVISLGLLSACGEKKAKEVKVDVSSTTEAAAEMKEEMAAKEAKIRFEANVKADSLRKVDSLRQVKEHGHAH